MLKITKKLGFDEEFIDICHRKQIALIHRDTLISSAFMARIEIDEQNRLFSISVTDEYGSQLLELVEDGTIQELLRADAVKEGLPL